MKGKIAIVTGGASGLGFGIAKSLSEKGARVVVFDCDGNRLQDLGDSLDTFLVDVTNKEQIQDAVNQVLQKYGTIDILVNSAGIIHSEPLLNIMNPKQMKHDYESFKRVLEIDLHSVFLVSSIVAEAMMMKRTKGVLIHISSISAHGNAGQTAYAAAKAAVNAMSKTWSKELGSMGIRSNVISPGFIDTPSTSRAINEKIISAIKNNTPLRRLGTVSSIAQSVSYLAENDFVNGAIIDVDGGLVI